MPVESCELRRPDRLNSARGNRISKNNGNLYRLLSAGSEAYTYDDAGNRLTGPKLTDSYTPGPDNHLLAGPRVSYGYDVYGNLTTASPWAYTWSLDNQLTKATNGPVAVTFKYDALGRRIGKTLDIYKYKRVMEYLYDGGGYHMKCLVLLFLFISLLPLSVHAAGIQKTKEKGYSIKLYIPKQGLVPDQKTAIAIAEAVLFPIYGEEKIKSERPYNVEVTNEIWKISGSLPENKLGGVFNIQISKYNAEILSLSHGK